MLKTRLWWQWIQGMVSKCIVQRCPIKKVETFECIKSVRLQLIEKDWQVSNKLEHVWVISPISSKERQTSRFPVKAGAVC